jgi:hypothetical protein
MMNVAMHESPAAQPLFELGPAHEPEKLLTQFRKAYRLRVPDFLEPAGALALHRHLAREIDWKTFLIAENAMYDASGEANAAHLHGTSDAILERAYQGARRGFACLHDANRLFAEDVPDGLQVRMPADSPLLSRFREFLNTPAMLGFFRGITGVASIEHADVQATRYRPGHFAMFHSTLPYSRSNGKRRIAFVINLTVEWKPEWGGLLEFKGAGNYQVEACIPSFNVLDIFSVHRGRWISTVSPFAEQSRLALFGWLYEREL